MCGPITVGKRGRGLEVGARVVAHLLQLRADSPNGGDERVEIRPRGFGGRGGAGCEVPTNWHEKFNGLKKKILQHMFSKIPKPCIFSLNFPRPIKQNSYEIARWSLISDLSPRERVGQSRVGGRLGGGQSEHEQDEREGHQGETELDWHLIFDDETIFNLIWPKNISKICYTWICHRKINYRPSLMQVGKGNAQPIGWKKAKGPESFASPNS